MKFAIFTTLIVLPTTLGFTTPPSFLKPSITQSYNPYITSSTTSSFPSSSSSSSSYSSTTHPTTSSSSSNLSAYELVLLRHGESTWNEENRFTGWADVPLSQKGLKEARQGGQLMKEEGMKVSDQLVTHACFFFL